MCIQRTGREYGVTQDVHTVLCVRATRLEQLRHQIYGECELTKAAAGLCGVVAPLQTAAVVAHRNQLRGRQAGKQSTNVHSACVRSS